MSKDVFTNKTNVNQEIESQLSEQTSSSTTNTKPQQTSSSNKFETHSITSKEINRTLIAPGVENIQEEEEEEEEQNEIQQQQQQQQQQQLEPASGTEQTQQSESLTKKSHEETENKTVEKFKFTLEPVVLNETDDSVVPTTVTTTAAAAAKTITVSGSKETKNPLKTSTKQSSNYSKHDDEKNKKDEQNEQVEIKVEEGYATRQMDEYFRQTIAAIKEELTKKLENKNEQNTQQQQQQQQQPHHHHHHHHHHKVADEKKNQKQADEVPENNYSISSFDSDEEEYESDIENIYLNNQCHTSDIDRTHLNCYRNYRTALLQNVLSAVHRKQKKSDKLHSVLVLLGCFLNQFIIDGLCHNYSNLFRLIQHNFDIKSKLIASIPHAFLIGFFLLFAPIALFLSKEFGTRRIAIIGSFLSTFSLLASSFLNKNIVLFSIFYGVLNGIGIGLIYIPSLISTSKWFLKKRLFANSLCMLCAAVGAAVYSIVSGFILRKYNLFDSIFILSSVQLNCLVGSMLYRNTTMYDTNLVLYHHHQYNKCPNNRLNKPSSTNNNNNSNINNANNLKPNGLANQVTLNKKRFVRKNVDQETESSMSTSTVTNYTLKQYWRKFVQTRNTSNNKKNLFHLIAEEKRKTRSLSKTSLEDGFFITTSNNLLAPNDDSNVVVSREARLAQMSHLNNTHNASSTSTSAASKFFSRIANSLRSLTSHGSQLNTVVYSKNQLLSTNLTSPQIVSVLETSKENETSQHSSPALLQKPSESETSGIVDNQTTSAITNEEKGALNEQGDSNPNNNNNNNSSSSSNSFYVDTNADDETSKILSNTSTTKANYMNAAQINRYITYRNSLTNSVRGSLMECSVPEENRESENLSSSNNLNNDDEEVAEYKNDLMNRASFERKRSRFRVNRASSGLSANSQRKCLLDSTVDSSKEDDDLYSKMNANKQIEILNKNCGAGYLMPSLIYLRRFTSTIDAASFFNATLNLESIEYNLRNSLIKKCSDSFRKKNRVFEDTSDLSSLFLEYLGYITSFKLIKNMLLIHLNASFFLTMIGICTPIIYICDYCLVHEREVSPTQSTYILSLMCFMIGLGRMISTISFKVNVSNSKSRIFSYILCLFTAGFICLVSTVLCDTLFSFGIFASCYGIFVGFILNLRPMLIYDIIGLEWSDDSLFFYSTMSQSIGAFIGIPLAGLIYDISKSYAYVYCFAGICLILAGLLLTPGRQLKEFYNSSSNSINKFYLHKKL